MENMKLRRYAMARGVKMWEIADKLGISSSWLSVKMRRPLSGDEAEKAMKYVDEIAENHMKSETV